MKEGRCDCRHPTGTGKWVKKEGSIDEGVAAPSYATDP